MGACRMGTKSVDALHVFVSTLHKAQTSVCLCPCNSMYLTRGSQPLSWTTCHATRGNDQRVISTTCVEEDLHFFHGCDCGPTDRHFVYADYGNPCCTTKVEMRPCG